MKSPLSLFQAKWNSSRGPHMLTPAAESRYSCETALYVAEPGSRGAPTSALASKSPTDGALRAGEGGTPDDRDGDEARGQHACDGEPQERRVGVHRASSRPSGR